MTGSWLPEARTSSPQVAVCEDTTSQPWDTKALSCVSTTNQVNRLTDFGQLGHAGEELVLDRALLATSVSPCPTGNSLRQPGSLRKKVQSPNAKLSTGSSGTALKHEESLFTWPVWRSGWFGVYPRDYPFAELSSSFTALAKASWTPCSVMSALVTFVAPIRVLPT